MPAVFRTLSDPANYREVATLWLALSTFLAVGGVCVGSLAVLFAQDAFRNGEMSGAWYWTVTLGYVGLVISPIMAWVLHARRRYWAAMVAAAWPVACLVLTWSQVAR
ncbi:hypothetical protein [Brevundimonas subvibrioides]|uniref:Uncharacterized protein n=1 Tax=Brevundimonas subvibrioides (strain ATCC 15264 / DSM 4735 / LMG 14903 / NBRC 16000 / CB 81) TaxID=633149 RepID=D9QN29_BRESC|nr:hypothetical protein [Brevundimonas subvibrioides]ADL00230.1 hypothetical protein Bresu_0917 [Brevundimonas subvibrioides ATCC 15264]